MTPRSAAAFLVLFPSQVALAQDPEQALRSLRPEEILAQLDLTRPGLEAAKAKVKAGRIEVLQELLAYYRKRHPLPRKETGKAGAATIEAADRVAKHIFRWGPYESADYGEDIDWSWDPRGDIEWVAAVYRFYWARDLEKAYRATRDEKYVRAFVELASDWIRKHPLEERDRRHPVYTYWRGYPWLDIQTGIRATVICEIFPSLVHGEAFTPGFLGVLLASLYDHQAKTEALPMGKVHNKAIFEQRGFITVASTFPEFRDSKRWMELAMERTRSSLLAQTTADGVQREWSFGYHLGVLRDVVEIMGRMQAMEIPVPKDLRQRLRKMHDYVFAIATPELAGPMFGDASRGLVASKDRARWPLYSTLVQATELLGNPKYAARARLDRESLPELRSHAFPEAGMYVLRNGWGREQIYFALHCSPPAISGHDQPDNGTFELYAHGRWLMNDTGYYLYGRDRPDRKWHRQTRVHQTLTLDGRPSPRVLSWRWRTRRMRDSAIDGQSGS